MAVYFVVTVCLLAASLGQKEPLAHPLVVAAVVGEGVGLGAAADFVHSVVLVGYFLVLESWDDWTPRDVSYHHSPTLGAGI